MKKLTFITTFAFVFLLLFTVNANAQKFSNLDKSALDIAYHRTDRNATPMIKVIYSRPLLKDRDVSTLAPNGKVWRTGANEAVEIKFFEDMKFGGELVKTGTYSLFTIPGETEWTIILNKDLDVWGAYSYKESNDVLRIKAAVSTGDLVEAFSMAFENDTMFLGWGTVRVSIPVSK